MALYQGECIRKHPKTKQVLKDEEGNPKIFGGSHEEKIAVRLKESTDAPERVFEVPQAVRNLGIVGFY